MKKINKIFITLASIVSISSLPIVAAACDVEKTEEGTGANSDTKDQEDQTSSKRPKGTNSSKGPQKGNKLLQKKTKRKHKPLKRKTEKKKKPKTKLNSKKNQKKKQTPQKTKNQKQKKGKTNS
nr:variable surface lipoprotein [Mycoplasmopsis bovis]QQH19049.1 variable surface lipoprotein [Mycoplasmopsis bovis]